MLSMFVIFDIHCNIYVCKYVINGESATVMVCCWVLLCEAIHKNVTQTSLSQRTYTKYNSKDLYGNASLVVVSIVSHFVAMEKHRDTEAHHMYYVRMCEEAQIERASNLKFVFLCVLYIACTLMMGSYLPSSRGKVM